MTPPLSLTVPDTAPRTDDPDDAIFFNRDVSWLQFNRRVLAQAADDSIPLLERVRFLSIFSSNLDEFFMKRVGLLKRQSQASPNTPTPDGLTPRKALVAVRSLVGDLQAEQFRIFRELIVPALARVDIHLLAYADLPAADRQRLDDWYRANVFPALTPLAVDPGHRFPFISNLSDSLGLVLSEGRGEDDPRHFARVKVPGVLQRFVPIPARDGRRSCRFVELSDLVRHNLDDLFPGMQVHEQAQFRVTRSAGIQRDDPVDRAGGDSLMTSVEEELRQRKFARAVRLEIEPDASPSMLRLLLDKLNLDQQDVYEQPGPMDYTALNEIADIDRPDLRFRPWKPVVPARLRGTDKTGFFAAIRKQDILVHHPYESFNASVERFIAAAAADPDVITIKQTLYRTSRDSPFIETLIRAAEAGKQVACLVELRARFDEGPNVRFARQLEKAGVHVAYGVVGLKTHCKTSLVVRKERSGLRCYAHIGTGNYNPKTAQLYTDLGLLTCEPAITTDCVSLFNYLTGLAATQSYGQLLVAPFNMRAKFNQLIEREIEHARRARKKGKGPGGRIIAKINSLEDRDITQRLYAASREGVQITLIVRGFCCLRPGFPGTSENIRVMSVVGRFLEHSRVFHFGGGSEDPLDGDWYIGSADWMYRNLSNRVEAAVPVREPEARRRLWRLIEVMLADHSRAWDLNTDGTYTPRKVPADAPADSPTAIGTFDTLMRDTAES
ncbi:MAG: polyphosphate kinase 1 [Phycisphaerales bacterium]|nr:polyphosphate kinase 1 [Phycisphaerales bacterium]